MLLKLPPSFPSTSSLTSGRASLGVSTIIFQLAMLAFIFLLKLNVSDEAFSSFLAVIGIAAIAGSAASMRSEVLIMQSDGKLGIRTLLWPILIAISTVAVFFVSRPLVAVAFDVEIPTYGIAVSLAMSCQAIGQFVLIQESSFRILLLLRLSQAVLLCVSGLATFFGFSDNIIAWAFALSLLSPFAIWSICWLIQHRAKVMPLYQFSRLQLRRGLVLSLTLMINTAAVNLPIILCVATQSASYSADFGFLMKVFVAPVTLANALFGQLFMADNIKYDVFKGDNAKIVRRNMRTTSLRASVFVLTMVIPAIIGVYGIAYYMPSFIVRPYLAFFIVFAAVAQAVFSPVSAIGDIAKIENSFLLCYVVRATALYLVLSATLSVDFSARFAVLNLVVYASFWFYADRRLSRISSTVNN